MDRPPITPADGIWRFTQAFESAPAIGDRLSLGEGATPAEEWPELAEVLGLDRLILKREDRNPTGSHKDRGAAYQISMLAAETPRPRWLIISSSGNAAIATARYGRLAGIPVAAFVAPRTPPAKLALIAAEGAVLILADRALTLARDVAAALGLPNLRPSTDPLAPEGFKTLGWELLEIDPRPEAVFTFASSATSLVGIGRAWLQRPEAVESSPSATIPQLHVVQGTGAHPVAGEFDPREVSDERGLVGSLGARKTRRVGEAKRLLRATGGSGWVVTDAEAEAADHLLRNVGIEAALEGAAALAAAGRAARESVLRSAAVVITGARRRPPAADVDTLAGAGDRVHRLTSLDEALAVLASHERRADPAAATTTASAGVIDRADFEAWAAQKVPGLTYAGPDPHYGIGLESLVPSMRFACLDATPAGSLLRSAGHPVLALADEAEEEGTPGSAALGRNTLAVLRDERTQDALAAGAPPVLMVFKSSHAIAQECEARGWRLLASEARVARRWENKVAFRDIAHDLGLPQPPGEAVTLSESTFAEVSQRLGSRLVVQGAHGYAGAKTFLVSDAASYDAAVEALRGRRARVSRLLTGETWTLNACVTFRGVAVGAPFRQITGLPELTTYRLGSCGQDWSATRRMGIDATPFVDMARTIGHGLAAEGYRGVFGVDYLRDQDGEVFVIEVNPRLVASIAAYTQLELAAGRLPLLARHVMALSDPKVDHAPLDAHRSPLEGGQLVLHHVGSGTARTPDLPTGWYGPRAIELLRAGGGVEALREVVVPAYRLDGEALRLAGHVDTASRGGSTSPGSAPPADAPWLVLAPQPFRALSPGDAWCRIQSRRPVADDDGLTSDVRALVRALQTTLGEVGRP